MAHRVGAGRQPALVEGHEKADGAGTGVVALSGSFGALPLHEARNAEVQVAFRAVDLEAHSVGNAFGEDLLGCPGAVGAPLGEIDHGFLRAPEVERRPAAGHGLVYGLHVRIGVRVQQLQEQGEVLGVALMRGGRQHQEMVGGVS